jgi:hypothetical protein
MLAEKAGRKATWIPRVEFEVGDEVLLRVSPTKGVLRFSIKRKLNPWYIGPFNGMSCEVSISYGFTSVNERCT